MYSRQYTCLVLEGRGFETRQGDRPYGQTPGYYLELRYDSRLSHSFHFLIY